MRKKRSLVIGLLALVMLFSSSTGVLATEIAVDENPIQHQVTSSFTVEVCNVEVIIPDNLDLVTEDTYNGELGLSCVAEIKAIGSMLPSKELVITAPLTVEFSWIPDITVVVEGDLLLNDTEDNKVVIGSDGLSKEEERVISDVYVFASYFDIVKGGSYSGTVTFDFEVVNKELTNNNTGTE